AESLGVVALGLEELLEVRLAVVLPVEGGVVTEGQPTGAVLALHTSLVEDLAVSVHPLHRIHRLGAGVTFYGESERHLLLFLTTPDPPPTSSSSSWTTINSCCSCCWIPKSNRFCSPPPLPKKVSLSIF